MEYMSMHPWGRMAARVSNWADKLWDTLDRHICEPLERAVLEAALLLLGCVALEALLAPPPAFRLLYVAPVWIAARAHGVRAGLVIVLLASLAASGFDAWRGRTDGFAGWANLMLYGLIYCLLLLNIARVEHGIQAYARMASLDPLTGVYNRLALQQAGERLISAAQQGQRPLVLAVIDCNRFKELNDQMGHASGDAALVALAKSLRRHVRTPGLVARSGGDEFVAMLPGMHLDEAGHVMDRVAAAFREQTAFLGQECSISVGLAKLGVHGSDLSSLLEAADRRMYMAKCAAADWASLATSA